MFDFNSLQGFSLTANFPPNTNRVVDYQSGVIVGVHAQLLLTPAQITASVNTFGGNIVLIPVASGFYIENVGRKKAIKSITMDMENSVGANVLYISINGTGNFVPITLGQTVLISGVQVTFPPPTTPGKENFKGTVKLKGKKIKSVFIGAKTVTKELYVDNIDVR